MMSLSLAQPCTQNWLVIIRNVAVSFSAWLNTGICPLKCLLGGICGWMGAILRPNLRAEPANGGCPCFKSAIESLLLLMRWLWVCGQRSFLALSTYPQPFSRRL